MTSGVSPTAGGSAATTLDEMSETLARNWWAVALRGVLAIIFGLIALMQPGAAILTFVIFFSAYMLVDGVFGIVAAVRAARADRRWGLLVLEALANIAVGIIAFVWPGLTAVAFVFMMAAWSIVTGVLMIVAALRLHQAYGKAWLVFGGFVSLLFGLALAAAPVLGLVVLTWWLGAYAIVFGICLLVLAFRLRGRNATAGAGPAAHHA